MGREFSSDPGCRAPPRAASIVNAATVSATPVIAAGPGMNRANSSAEPVKIAVQPTITLMAAMPGDSLRCQGTTPVSIMEAAQTVDNGQDQPGEAQAANDHSSDHQQQKHGAEDPDAQIGDRCGVRERAGRRQLVFDSVDTERRLIELER